MLGYRLIFAGLTALIFALLGALAGRISNWLFQRPRVVVAVNLGAGLTFLAAALSILVLGRRSAA